MSPVELLTLALCLFPLFFFGTVAIAYVPLLVCWLARRAVSVARGWVLPGRRKPSGPAPEPARPYVVIDECAHVSDDQWRELARLSSPGPAPLIWFTTAPQEVRD